MLIEAHTMYSHFKGCPDNPYNVDELTKLTELWDQPPVTFCLQKEVSGAAT